MTYLCPLTVTLALIYGCVIGQVWTFQVLPFVWLAGAVLDVGLPVAGQGASESRAGGAGRVETPHASSDLAGRLCLWSWVPVQTALLVAGLLAATADDVTNQQFFQLAVAIGFAEGFFTVPVVHELLHRRSLFDRHLAEWLMTMMCYPHFCVTHLESHHREVGTPDDPDTARLGESFYSFYPRSFSEGLLNAWCAEATRMKESRGSMWSPKNRMVRYFTMVAGCLALVGFLFGWKGVIFFALTGVLASSTITIVNYIQHYGLTRRAIAAGRYEAVQLRHSWNSRHRATNWFFMNLGRHSDHHVHSAKAHSDLETPEDTPQLPAGFFVMICLALAPPLWRRMMDWKAESWNEFHSGGTA